MKKEWVEDRPNFKWYWHWGATPTFNKVIYSTRTKKFAVWKYDSLNGPNPGWHPPQYVPAELTDIEDIKKYIETLVRMEAL